MKNFYFNWMKNAAKNTQTTGGGTSRRCEDANQSRIASDPIPCRYRVDTVSLPCFGYTPGISGRLMKYAAMIFCMFVLGVGQMWGGDYAVVADWRANTGIGNINAAIGSTGDNVTFSPINKGKALTSTAITNSGNTTNAIAISENYSSSGGNFIDIRVPAGYKIKSVDSIYITSGSTITSKTGVYMCYAASQLIALDAKNTSPGTETTFSLPNVSTGGKCYGGVGFTPSFPGGSSITSADSIRCVRLYKKASSGTNYYVARLKVTVATVSAPAASGKNIYLKPNGIWDKDGARFAAYYWKSSGSGNGWVDFASYNTCTPCFKATIPSGYDKVILCRMNGATAVNNWDNSWNQTLDQTVPTGNDTCFTISSINGCTDGKSCGSWGTYTAPTYTISYAANSGSGSMSSQTSIACGTDKATTSNTFTAPSGYQFAGWIANVDVTVGGVSKTAGTLLADGVTIQDISSNITLTAQWEAVKYTVTYNVNGGGSVDPTSATQASSGASVTLPTPTWSGYTFDGWYNAGTKIGNGGASYTPTADITLYAHWTDNISGKVFSFIDNNYGDKFKSFTGYGWVEKDSTGRSKTFTNASTGVEYRVSAAGWDKKNNAISALAKFFGGTSSMSIVIPTGKIATVKVSYGAYGNGDDYKLTINSADQAAVSSKLDSEHTNAQVISDMKEITLNSQTGTLTLGIHSSSKNLYIGRVSAVITGYTVSYAAGTYGSGSLASGTKTAGSSFTLSSNSSAFTRDGYVYDGWSTNADGNTKDYNLGGTYSTDAAITLYPHWVASCTAPSALAAATPTAKGITLSVTDANNVNNYEFYVSTSSTAPEAGATATHSVSSAKSLTITNLVAGTTYYAWARSVCGVSNKSGWTALGGGGTFTTSTVSADYHPTNVTKTAGATSGIGGSNFTATFSANTDYSLPSTITVTIGGNSATSGTDYTWSDGTLTIPASKINGDIDITVNSAPAAPSSVNISGAYLFFPGETISLTATPTGGNGPTTYQWQKKINGDWTNITLVENATAQSANFQIASATTSNTGNYRCVVTKGGTQSLASDQFDMKCLQLYTYYNDKKTDYGNWAFERVDETHASLSVYFNLGGDYVFTFKVTDGLNNWYGNTGTMTGANNGPWTLDVNSACGVTVGKAASYVFKLDFSAGIGNSMTMKVDYPSADQAAGKVIYLDNSVLTWSGSSIYYRIGHNTYNTNQQLTLVPGTTSLYRMKTSEFNGFAAWHIGNAAGQTGSDKSIYNTKNGTAITAATEFEGGAVSDTVTVTPVSAGSYTGGDSQNDNCTFYKYGITSKMKTQTVTISDYSNGTITVNYVDTGNVARSFTSGSMALPHTVVLTSITAVPASGYEIDDALTINGDDYEANHVVTGATTVAASFKPATYTVMLNTNSGTINAGNVTAYTYLTGATLPTNVTRDGYRFMGWYATSNFSTDRVYTIGTSEYGNKEYWAKWAQLYTITNGSPANGTITVASSAAAGDVVDIEATPSSGYVFDEWDVYKTGTPATKVSTAAATASTSFTMPAYAVTVNASFEVKTYTLSYAIGTDATGSASGGSSAGSYPEDATITVPAKGTLDSTGCTFRGWTDGTTFYTAGQSFSMPASNVTLTAVWEGASGGSYTYTFESSKPGNPLGTYFDITTSAVSGHTYEIASSLNSNNIKASDLVGGGSYFLGGTISTSNVSATYKTKASYTNIDSIAFYENASDNGKPTYVFKVVDASSGTALYTSPTLDHRTIKGSNGSNTWTGRYRLDLHSAPKTGKIQIDVTSGSTTKYYALDNITVYYKGNDTNFDVTFNMKSHGDAVSSYVGVPNGKQIVAPAAPTASGYIFGGWYTDSSCTSAWDWGSSTVSKDTTLYAKWTAKTQPTQYTVTIDAATVCSGSSTNIKMASSQSGVSYQLYKGEDKVGDAKDGGSALTWSSISTTGTYKVMAVENATYAAREMSNTVSLANYDAVSIKTHPTSEIAATVDAGSDMSVVLNTGTFNNATYTWQTCTDATPSSSSDISSGSQYANYTTNTLSFTPPTAGTYYFRCKVTDDCGTTVYSNVATVTASVAKEDPTVYTLSGTTSVCEGDEATITLDDSDDGVTYALYLDGVDQSDDKVGDGNAITWTVTADGTYTVSAKADATYNAADMDGSAVISYKTATAIGTQPTTAVSGHDGVNFTLGSDLAATGEGTLTYQWYSYTSAEGAGQATVGSATTTKTLTTSKAAGTYYYKVEVIATCGSVKSEMITVTIDNKHKLTYNANGGSGEPEAEYRAAGSAALSATEPTRTNYRFLGWNTKNDGTGDHYDAGASFTMGTSAVILYAEWGETATLTWTLTTGTGESSVSTSDKNSTNGTRIAKSNMSNLLNNGLTITNNSKSGYTVKIEAPATKNNDKYMYVTFVVADNYELVPSAVTATFQPVDATASADMILSDTHGHSISLTGASCSKGSPNEKTITNGSGVAFSGTVTLKIYCYGSSVNTYRLGSTITITGDINYVCPERATITSPTAPQSIKLYSDQNKTLSVSATAYAGTLNYQWQKDGVDIDGATSATYTVEGSGLTAGTTYVYTCNVSETSPASCATVTSPAFNVKAASMDCNYTEFSSAVLTSKTAATTVNATLLASNMSNSSAPYKLDKTLPSYFGLQLSSGNFQVGDSIIFKVKINDMNISGYDDYPVAFYHSTDTSSYTPASALYIAGGQTKNTDNIYIRFVVSQAMIDAGLTNKILIIRSGRVTQNHSMYEARIKRYVCPDVYVFDAADSGLWSDEDNWIGAAGHGSGLPTIDDRAIITKPITVDIAHATASEVRLDQSSTNTGSLSIQANKGLEVAGTIRKTTDGSSYSATGEADLVLESSSAGNASLIFENAGNEATVMQYSKASIVGNTWNWQYVGTPFTGSIPLYNYYGSWMYKWNNGGWSVVKGSDELTPFVGYCLTQESATTHVMGGTLVPTTSTSVTMGTDKDMVLANSWTAPISIASFDIEGGDATFTSTPATIYLFNTGSAKDGSSEGTEAGTYIAVPINSAPYTGNGLIAPMQGFFVTTNGGSAGTITMNYNDLVRPAGEHTDIVAGPMKAPRRAQAAEAKPAVMKIQAIGSKYNDRVVILARENFSTGFDNGWDGKKMSFGSESPSVYVINDQGGYDAVSAIPTFEGTVVGFRAGADNNCTMTFSYEGEDIWYLNDLQAQQSTLIDATQTYTFTTSANDSEVRFVISATPIQKVPTGIENGGLMNGENDGMVRKLIINDHVYIIRSGRMYSVDGQMVK